MYKRQVISLGISKYIVRTTVVTIATLAVFTVVIVMTLYTYRKHQKQIENIVFVDSVTGGMNNLRFKMLCQDILRSAPEFTYAMVCINMQDFKLINANFGSEKGNETLRYVMRILEKNCLDGELADRGAADQFYLLLKENKQEQIQTRLSKIVEEINQFNVGKEEPYYLRFFQGAYLVDDPFLDITVIQDRATTACKSQEKETGRCMFYNTVTTAQLQKEKEINDMCESSLKNGDFKVYLQPKVSLKDNKVGGAEALVRWLHPVRGMIYPSDFIPAFEKSGFICEIDLFVFEEICKLIQRWKQEKRQLIPISVNISRRHFNDPDFLKKFHEISKQYQIPKGLIEMELTESIFFTDEEIEAVKEQRCV